LGNLLGWQVWFNLSRHRLDAKFYVKLSGDSLEAFQQQLVQLYLNNRLTLSIKPQSLIHLLEEIATIPPEIEHLLMKETWGEVGYYKRKRGDMRILYFKNADAKTITFNTYHKNELH
jgi:mRNA-degrading endonuclease RelE of RelBE toxin-antitoxin system